MKSLPTSLLGIAALALIGCNNGGEGIPQHVTGAAGTGTSAGTAGTGGGPGTAGTDVTGPGTAGTGQTGGTTGTAGSTPMGAAGATGTGGAAGSGGAVGTAGASGSGGGAMGAAGTSGSAGTMGGAGAGGGAATGLRQGPFKIIVLTTTLEFRHDSIPTCLQMLMDLGKATAPERATIPGLAADSTWTVDHILDDPSQAAYFTEVTAANLKNYEMFYSDNPTGKVFTNAPMGAQKKQIFVDFWNSGGSWAGQHSATDFENSSAWTWFQDNVNGGWFTMHDNDGTPGTVTWQTEFVNHPILKGLTSPWNTTDEWYVENRNIEAVPGFKVLAKVTVSNSMLTTMPRPAVWINENANMMGGRSFYTIRGHNQKVYAEQEFRQLMLRGILWAVHRLPGGN
jgi:type 1 glutamine amidotransferase